MKANPDQCHLLLTTNVPASVNINSYNIKNSSEEKLLGIKIDNKLSFESHVSSTCEKASEKLHALTRIANYMDLSKRRTLMKTFVISQFNYCPLVWMFHSRKLVSIVYMNVLLELRTKITNLHLMNFCRKIAQLQFIKGTCKHLQQKSLK